MTKTLSERVKMHMANRQNKSANKVAFLGLKDDIADALGSGLSMIAIWETLYEEGKITTTYNTFRLNVARYINNKQTAHKNGQNSKSELKGFTYDPKANIDHLI